MDAHGHIGDIKPCHVGEKAIEILENLGREFNARHAAR